MLKIERLKECLRYDAAFGRFYALKPLGARGVGKEAGSVNSIGYRYVSIDRVTYLEHRLVWFYCYGEWPKCDIDHINGDKKDNRIENLRLATVSQNCFNTKISKRNTSGFKGVDYHKPTKKWRAAIKISGKNYHIGLFATAEEAGAAYAEFAKKAHGEFYNSVKAP